MELVVDTLSALRQSDRQAEKEAAVAGGQALLRKAAARRKGQKAIVVHIRTTRRSPSHALWGFGLFSQSESDLGAGNH